MKIIYQKLKTKLRPILKLNDDQDVEHELELLCLKHLGMGVLERAECPDAFIFRSVLIFQKPAFFVVKGVNK